MQTERRAVFALLVSFPLRAPKDRAKSHAEKRAPSIGGPRCHGDPFSIAGTTTTARVKCMRALCLADSYGLSVLLNGNRRSISKIALERGICQIPIPIRVGLRCLRLAPSKRLRKLNGERIASSQFLNGRCLQPDGRT